MQITLYNQTIALDHMQRNMANPVTITGYLREACDIIAPDITLNYNGAVTGKNYAYIPDFGRYYYFRKPPTIEGDIMELHLYADSLYNYRNEIYKAHCIAERSSSLYELMLEDTAVNAVAGYEIFSCSLPYEFRPDMGVYVLTVAGG